MHSKLLLEKKFSIDKPLQEQTCLVDLSTLCLGCDGRVWLIYPRLAPDGIGQKGKCHFQVSCKWKINCVEEAMLACQCCLTA